jgi:predicted TIM-barrel fold metal-dependent hydrolase
MHAVKRQQRRALLGSLAAYAGVMAIPRLANAAARDLARRIDVHHHIAPPALVTAGRKVGIHPAALQWSAALAVEAMDRFGIATGITSIPDLGDWGKGESYWRLIRDCNEYAARLRSDYPGRFGLFAALPWPDVDATLREIGYVFDTLKAEGVFFWTSYGDHWFGDPKFAPVFEELQRRKAVVYTHPRSADCCRALGQPFEAGVIEWQTDTTRALAEWIFTGSMLRYPDVQLIFSHGGGTMTALIGRLENAALNERGRAAAPQGFRSAARHCYYDTSLQLSAAQLWPLKNIVGVERILFGSDYPFSVYAGHPVQELRQSGVFSASELAAINRGNARRLFPGVAD